ncbi:hypothetical protein JXM83_05170 [Candidatus Woesearchaeota archaeon]|nr:hypothetical protein [Candidatus Woesearchaeota archaeon]
MKPNLEKILINLCEKLPQDITLYEEDFCCLKKTDDCKYSKKHGDKYLCYKKTYTGYLQHII